MSKKNINTDSIMNELQGASLFFSSNQPKQAASLPSLESPAPVSATQQTDTQVSLPDFENQPSLPEATTVKQPEQNIRLTKTSKKSVSKYTSNNASMLASTPDSKSAEMVELIRKTVKTVGKDPLFIRMTPEEKRELNSVIYAFNDMYRDSGRKTSENEAGRIAVNFILEDYRQNGQNSILARVLAALNA